MRIDTAFQTFPQLETRNLLLRSIESTDAEAIYHIFADDEVTRLYDLDTFTSVEQATQLIERMRHRFERQEAIRWGIARKPNPTLVGTCGFTLLPSFRGGLGYDLARAYWRQGIMTEALSAILQFGFEKLGLNRVEALVMLENTASVHLLRKLGFQEEGILKEYAFFKGRFHDLRSFSILKSDDKN
jgi:ribosomal-protein-alanine N-acetyltransferase